MSHNMLRAVSLAVLLCSVPIALIIVLNVIFEQINDDLSVVGFH